MTYTHKVSIKWVGEINVNEHKVGKVQVYSLVGIFVTIIVVAVWR